MPRLFTATFLLLLCLVTVSSQAQSPDSETDLAPWSQPNAFESEDMSVLAPRRPRTVHRCCAKPNYGTMFCRESTDRLLAWANAIISCEHKYGKGNCVSGCRRLLRR